MNTPTALEALSQIAAMRPAHVYDDNTKRMLDMANIASRALAQTEQPEAAEPSPMAKAAAALRQKAEQEEAAYQARRSDQGLMESEWGPMEDTPPHEDQSTRPQTEQPEAAAHRELYFSAYTLCDGICEDHPAISDVMNTDSHGRLCDALAKLDPFYGIESPEQRIAADSAPPSLSHEPGDTMFLCGKAAGRQEVLDEQTGPDFWSWVRRAYRNPEATSFTVHNMAVAYRAGRDSATPGTQSEDAGLVALRAELSSLREDTSKGDPIFRCGFNGALDVIRARIDAIRAVRRP